MKHTSRLLLAILLLLFLAFAARASEIKIEDSFDTDVWTADGSTTWDSQNKQLYLTHTETWKFGRVFTKDKFTTDEFTAEFDMKIGGGSGADGIVFGWAASYDYSTNDVLGGKIGFAPAQGYGVEFDCYQNNEYHDHDGQHVAVIQNNTATHLHTNQMDYGALEDNRWHHVLVYVRREHVRVYIDDDRYINHQIPNYPHNQFDVQFGFTSATGVLMNNHIIKNVKITAEPVEDPPPPAPVITVTQPNGGESITAGTNQLVDWTTEGTIDHYNVFYSTNNGNSYSEIGRVNSPGTDIVWAVPGNLNSNNCLVLVVGYDANNTELARDVSNGAFTIAPNVPPPVINVTMVTPNGGDDWKAGHNYLIDWTAEGTIDHFGVYYSTNGGENWNLIETTNGETTDLTWAIPGDINSANCKIKVVAFDGDNGELKNDVSDATFSITPDAPAPDPAVTILSPNGGESILVGQPFLIDWITEGNIDHSTVYYSTDGGVTYITIGSVNEPTTELNWLVPEDLFSVNCLIRVIAFDALGNEIARDLSNAYFTIEPVDLRSPGYYAGWWLVSVPLQAADPKKELVIGDDIPGIWDWYQFDYNTGYWRPDNAETGPGYWLAIAHDSVTIDVEGTANTDTFRIVLDTPWNIIGDPFPGPVPLDAVMFRDGDHLYTKQEAVDSSLIVPVLTSWTPETGYFESNTLNPWFGYWFLCLKQDLEMLIPPPVALTNVGRDAAGVDPEEFWEIHITASSELGRDNLTSIGACQIAQDGWDARFDIPEALPNPNGDYVSVYTSHEDWVEGVNRFNSDIRKQLNNQTATYNLSVKTSKPASVTLNWPDLKENVPDNFVCTLTDPSNNESVNMALADEFTVNVGEEPYPLVVTVKAPKLGVKEETAPVVSNLELLSAYPNPFNPATTVSFNTVVSSNVTVKVYDLFGKEVTTLVNGRLAAGSHSIEWNASGNAAGVYLVRLQGEGFSAVKKVVLMK